MIPYFTTAETIADLEGILALQSVNLASSLDAEEIRSQGFVTVQHTMEILLGLNKRERHVIAKIGEEVIGYVLAMPRSARYDIPVLLPMFEVFDRISFRGRAVSDWDYIVAGQACVAKPYRGIGILEGCYHYYRECYAPAYDFLITEIARTNTRSLRAHQRIGFVPIHTYTDPGKTEWEIVVWDWS